MLYMASQVGKNWHFVGEEIQDRFHLRSVPVKFLGIVGQDPSDSKSSRLYVDIFRFCFTHLRYIL